MATPTTKTASESVTDIPALAQKSREQLVSGLQQGQQLSIDAAQSWVKAVSALPVVDLPKIPGIPAVQDLQAATKYTFDVASDLLNAQRAFAVQLTNVLVPAQTA
ncbi:MAG TPA: hypothetical protein VFE92_06760 [Dermatophilaceae bacterium]|nr:hypothetical protein [Dermatophilaceae bacterium]